MENTINFENELQAHLLQTTKNSSTGLVKLKKKADKFLERNTNSCTEEFIAKIKSRDLQSNSDMYLAENAQNHTELEAKGIAYLLALDKVEATGITIYKYLDEIRKDLPHIIKDPFYAQIHHELDRYLASGFELERQYEKSGMYNYFFDHFGIDTLLTENIYFKLQTMDIHEVALIGRIHRFDKLDGDIEVYTRIETDKHYEELLPFQTPTIPILSKNKMPNALTPDLIHEKNKNINKIFEVDLGSKPNLRAQSKVLTNILGDTGYFYLE